MSERTCCIEACERPIHNKANGWCEMHYHRWHRYGDPLITKRERRPCGLVGCDEPVVQYGLCVAHAREHDVPEGFRRCSRCLQVKASGSFSPNPAYRRDGIDGVCRPCRADAIRAQRAADPTKARQDAARYRHRHPDRVVQSMRKWQSANKMRLREISSRRRARKAQAPSEDVRESVVFERDAWICRLCGTAIDPALRYPDVMSASVDHVQPLARGGCHTYDNVQAAHLLCNMKKGART